MLGLPLQAVARVLMLLAVIVLLLAGLFFLMRRLRERGETDGDSGDLLTSFRDIHERGQLSEEEFRAIRRRLAAKMQGELKHDEDRS